MQQHPQRTPRLGDPGPSRRLQNGSSRLMMDPSSHSRESGFQSSSASLNSLEKRCQQLLAAAGEINTFSSKIKIVELFLNLFTLFIYIFCRKRQDFRRPTSTWHQPRQHPHRFPRGGGRGQQQQQQQCKQQQQQWRRGEEEDIGRQHGLNHFRYIVSFPHKNE